MRTRVGVTMQNNMVQRYTMGPFDHTSIVPSRDLAGVLRGLRRRMRGAGAIKATDFTNTIHGITLLGRVDLLHLFNTLSIGRRPYVVCYEQYLPRWNPLSRFGLRRMVQPECRRLVAMSQFAHRYQLNLLAQQGSLGEALHEKMTVLHPAQRLILESYDLKPPIDQTIRCLFVGRDFFRKGGREVLMVLRDLIAEGLPLQLTVVSSLDAGDYASHATAEDRAWVMNKLEEGRQVGILHHTEQTNEEVLRLMLGAHLVFLPTYDDTYGFSVLEAQAAGCPVITTDVCAMPEINTSAVGWLIEVDKDGQGVALRSSAAERERLSERIRLQLDVTMREICRTPHRIREKGIQALDRIRQMHDPHTVARAMESIYDDALRPPAAAPAGQATRTSELEPISRRAVSISER